jgi:type I restriction enzyme S subunit
VNITVGKLGGLPVPLPPRQKMLRILAEIERRLSVIDELEMQVQANLKRAERLRQAIPKRAFEGKLVSQDPDDEPACVLLERIRTARSTATPGLAKSERIRKSGTATPGCAPVERPRKRQPVAGPQ